MSADQARQSSPTRARPSGRAAAMGLAPKAGFAPNHKKLRGTHVEAIESTERLEIIPELY